LVSWLSFKTKVDGLSVVWASKSMATVCEWFGLKTARTVSAGLASKPAATVSGGLTLKLAVIVFTDFGLKIGGDGFR
jgi:hypothetical protein